MGLYNEEPRFVPMIRDGRKTSTIRAERENEDVVGDIMHLYTGLRTKGAMLIFRAPCVKVEPIRVSRIGLQEGVARVFDGITVRVNEQILDASETELLALNDGFETFAEMTEWWAPNIPFNGKIYHWDFEKRRMDRF